ncbi:MAG: Gfo/Idh/MocA family oxidoreductase [Saprospiraceae bacterium]|nr:Gfo/Idh/MocA family oxidoreductase [Saprospiraceae bacterium]
MDDQNKSGKWSRRDMMKGLAGVPVVGAVLWAGAAKAAKQKESRENILNTLNINASAPPDSGPMSGDPIRLGIIGFGIRGPQLCRALGFATKDWLKSMKDAADKNPNDTRLSSFLEQENLNIQITAVCDLFDVRAQEAADSFSNDKVKVKIYKHHQELLDSKDVDAVVIATADHWHAPIAIAALAAGKHVYLEKPMTHGITETYALQEAVKKYGKVFQVGHQHRQTQSFVTARDVIEKKILGHISLVTANTNRNSDNGAWQYDIHEKANPNTVDWKQFLGNAPDIPFNAEHFFRWRKWWSYGSGLSGDLMVHDYDRINCVLKMGIPKTVVSSGGIYTHRDGRTVPDVMQINMEFPDFTTGSSREAGKEIGMTLVYSATLGNQYNRTTVLMGHDASMELGSDLVLYADSNSTRFKDMLEAGTVDANVPLYRYDPSANAVDGITSATSKYFADKGLLYTYRNGRRVDSTHLHMREWLSGIRNGTPVSCGIQEGFEEVMTAHMGGLSYKLGRRIEFDHAKNEIVPVDGHDLDQVLVAEMDNFV